MHYLDVVDASGNRRRIDLTRPRLLIGREPSCDICLPHAGVSRRHAQLQVTDQGRWLLQDLSSLNHVFVDEKPIQQLVLEPRKPFHITEYTLILEEEPSAHDREAAGALRDAPPETGALPDPAWLERLQMFQRSLFSVDEPREVLQRMAREIQRCLRPRLLAVSIIRANEHSWDLVLCDDVDGPATGELAEADRRISDEEGSAVQTWVPSTRLPALRRTEGEVMQAGDALALLIPMKGRSGIVGHVYVQGAEVQPVPRSMQHYLSVLAALSGLMWDTLQLAALRIQQLALEKELDQARQIQLALFPQTFAIDPRLDVFGVNLPSALVSGDYYDLIRTGPDTVAFVIADAMGHGMPAALLMAAVRSALRMGFTLGLAWPAMFRGLDAVTAQARSEMFVTGLVGHIDLVKQELELVCAGHPLPSILVDGKSPPVPPSCWTRPWGLEMPTKWEAGHISLQGKNWSILCYTDGITDAAARTQRRFGAQRIAAFHGQHCNLDAEDLCQGLLSEVAVQPGKRSLEDDQTVLVLRSIGR
jgi:Stage II sporulation protein E (SpoIIE)/FHA domain